MDNKLTLADVLKYPNAQLQQLNNVGKIVTHHIEADSVTLKLVKPMNIEYRLKYSDCKLKLRPIESLTEEEKDNLSEWQQFKMEVFIDYDVTDEDFVDSLLGRCWHSNIIETVDYLRSINIDIDGFIKSGKAVAK